MGTINAPRRFRGVKTNEQFLFNCFVSCYGRGIPEPKTGYVSFFVDSGATDSIIAESDCLKLEIDIENLPKSPRPIGGWGGGCDAYLIEKTILLLKDENGKTEEIEYDNILCACYVNRKKKTKWQAKPLPSVLGINFLMKGYKFNFNPAQNDVYIEQL